MYSRQKREWMKNKELPIWLYVPNIVGYFRLTFLLIGLLLIRSYPVYGSVCFICNLFLDALDGQLARVVNQCSSFGAILDYTIDRISFASYVVLLATVYPSYVLILCICLNLDLTSHFFHLKSSYALKKASHKEMGKDEPMILQLYYRRLVLGSTCLSHDLFFILLYLYYFYPTFGLQLFLGLAACGAFFKMTVHVTQIGYAIKNLLGLKKIL